MEWGLELNFPIGFRGLPGAGDDIVANMTTAGRNASEL